MILKLHCTLMLLMVLAFTGELSAESIVKIGVLNSDTSNAPDDRWKALQKYLQQQIPEKNIQVSNESFDGLADAIASRNLDFIIANPAHYTEWAYRFGLSSPLATVVREFDNKPLRTFGGVIFTRNDNDLVNTAKDIPNKKIAVASLECFAGFRMQQFELKTHDVEVNPDSDLVQLVSSPEQIIQSVMDKTADIGFLRTGVLESMSQNSQLDLAALKIINRQKLHGYPFLSSTRLYPEWVIAASPLTDQDLLKKVTSSLLSIKPDDAVARELGIHGFDVPADYSSVLKVLQTLRISPFDITPQMDISDILAKYRWQMFVLAIFFIALTTLTIYLSITRQKLSEEIEEVEQGRIALNQKADELFSANEKLEKLAAVFVHSHDGIMLTDENNDIVEVNEAFCRITGFQKGDVLGQNPKILSSGRQPTEFYKNLWQGLKQSGSWSGEVWNRKKDGELFAELLTISVIYDSKNIFKGYVGVFTDITQIKEHQQKIEYLAHYDALTKLPNRFLLTDRMQQALSQAKRHQSKVAVVFMDLDGFKEVNDKFGHEAGDDLLINISQRMQKQMRDGDTLARLGGDEFVAILIDVQDQASCAITIERLLDTVKNVHIHSQKSLNVTVSAGVTIYPESQAEDPEQLLRQADHAMYHAKITGKDRYHFFDAALDSSIRGHHQSLAFIRKALENEQFVLFYQPKVDLHNNEVIGVEALIRWQHPERGLLPPSEFLPLVEGDKLDFDIGDWVIKTAIKQVAIWHEQSLNIPVSVNISGKHLLEIDFVERLEQSLASEPSVESKCLEIEILETTALDDVEQVASVMRECMKLGVNFALDDFGTGYSTLSLLQQLPANTLKIDRSFVRDILFDENDLEIAKGIITLANSFKRMVIAEGVETKAHGSKLLSIGCHFAQGFGIAKPMTSDSLPGWIKRWQSQAIQKIT